MNHHRAAFDEVSLMCAIVVLAVLGVYLNYGSITPCGILKRKVAATLMDYASKESRNKTLMTGMAAAAGGLALEAQIELMSPLECIQRLLDYDGIDTSIRTQLSIISR